jgi:hypothetical protein
VSIDGLPDPNLDPNAYTSELAKRINGVIEARTHSVRTEVQSEMAQNQSVQQLWSRFSAQYPEWAAHEQLVGVVANDVATKAQAKGLDLKRYMFGNSDLYLADVAKELSTKYGALVPKEEDGSEGEDDGVQSGERGPIPAHGADLDSGRTEIFGGQESGGKPARQGDEPPVKSGLMADLTAIQRKMGLI